MKDEDSKALLAILGIPVLVVLVLIMFIPLGLFNAWAVQKMYIWFALPLGAPALKLAHVWGFGLILNHYLFRAEDNKKGALGRIGISLFGTLLMLLMGFILKSYI